MAYPDPDSPYVLHTDASETGLGAVLYLEQIGILLVIAYGSETLMPAEKIITFILESWNFWH